MIILSIDSGIEKTGYAFFDKNKKYKENFKYVTSGLITTSKKETIAVRINQIYDQTKTLIQKYKPNKLILEQIFFFKNQKTAIKVSQTQGVLLLLGAQYNLPIEFLTPLQIKLTVTGYGHADKKAVRKMIDLILNNKIKIIDDDQSDAIAGGLAYCLLNKQSS